MISIHNDTFGDRIFSEYHKHYLAMYQKAAYQSTSDLLLYFCLPQKQGLVEFYALTIQIISIAHFLWSHALGLILIDTYDFISYATGQNGSVDYVVR